MKLLLAKSAVLQSKQALMDEVKKLPVQQSYIGIVHRSDNASSDVYLRMKQKFGQSVGLEARIFSPVAEKERTSAEAIKKQIESLNHDDNCIGIIVQLPLPPELFAQTQEICSRVSPHKDSDGLGGVIVGLAQSRNIDFLPATAAAVMALLAFYNLGNVQGKKVALLGQSSLIGKPLAMHLIHQGATVFSFNEYSDQEYMREVCRESDYIIAGTGVVHLVDQSFVSEAASQVLVDVGYGHRDGKAVGDIDFEQVVDKVSSISPVPGGVGPLTVHQLFANTIKLFKAKQAGLL